MAKAPQTAITPTRAEDYPEWYQQVVRAADLAELSPVRGCMVIKPWGYALWENMQRVLDRMFKETGHVNAYFPLFIPLSYLEKEAEHVEGFAKECAVVTHHRLEVGEGGRLVPTGKLEEPLVVRPTSETIIGAMYAKWVKSYRDLPILINQWANVVRWELRTRMFLRTTEFLWQEGHTAHATRQEAEEETRKMLDVYATFAQDYIAMPVIRGEKTAGERFPGAVDTYTIEAMMQDRKALQAGTSHFLGQNFAKAQEIKYLSAEGREEFAWTTSWGVTTRLVGALTMTHSDDDGLVLPPRLAPQHVVVLPIYRNDEESGPVLEYCRRLQRELVAQTYDDGPVRAMIDERDVPRADKKWMHIKRGVPILVEVGPRDIAGDTLMPKRRDEQGGEKKPAIGRSAFVANIGAELTAMQQAMFDRAKAFRAAHTRTIDNLREFEEFFTPKSADKPEIHGGFAICHLAEGPQVAEILAKHKVSIRCVPVADEPGFEEAVPGKCVFTAQPTTVRVILAKAYEAMGAVGQPAPALFILAAFSRYAEALAWARERAAMQWGEIALASPIFEFQETDYYEGPMGAGIQKCFWAFERLIDQASLPELKLASNQWELDYAKEACHPEPRPLNLDPGYVTAAKLVLASTKDHAHRIYLSRGIYAEVTLYYKNRRWQAREWTFPDYRRPEYHEFFSECRKLLRSREREEPTS